MFLACEKIAFGDYFWHDGFLFKKKKLYVSICSLRELLVRETYSGELMGHFGIAKTLHGEKKAELIQQIHETARLNTEKMTEQYAKQANKGRRKVVFESGD